MRDDLKMFFTQRVSLLLSLLLMDLFVDSFCVSVGTQELTGSSVKRPTEFGAAEVKVRRKRRIRQNKPKFLAEQPADSPPCPRNVALGNGCAPNPEHLVGDENMPDGKGVQVVMIDDPLVLIVPECKPKKT